MRIILRSAAPCVYRSSMCLPLVHGERPATSQVVAIVLVFAASVAPWASVPFPPGRLGHRMSLGLLRLRCAPWGKLCPFTLHQHHRWPRCDLALASERVVTFPHVFHSALFLVLCWWLLPVLVGFLISVATPNKMFTDRYMISYTPDYRCRCLAGAVGGPVIARRVIIALSALSSPVAYLLPTTFGIIRMMTGAQP